MNSLIQVSFLIFTGINILNVLCVKQRKQIIYIDPVNKKLYEFKTDRGDIISLWYGDISKMNTDAIVNAANSELAFGSGVSNSIRNTAGELIVTETTENFINKTKRVETGNAICIPTNSKLVNYGIKYVIHAVGPRCHAKQPITDNHKNLLHNCISQSLGFLQSENISSITLPVISSKNFGCDPGICAEILFSTCVEISKSFNLVTPKKDIRIVILKERIIPNSEKVLIEKFCSQNKGHSDKYPISIKTWNILNQSYYDFEKKIDPDTRKQKVLDIIGDIMGQKCILCLQEVDNDILKKLKHLYESNNTIISHVSNKTRVINNNNEAYDNNIVTIIPKNKYVVEKVLGGNKRFSEIIISTNGKQFILYNVHLPVCHVENLHKLYFVSDNDLPIFVVGDFNKDYTQNTDTLSYLENKKLNLWQVTNKKFTTNCIHETSRKYSGYLDYIFYNDKIIPNGNCVTNYLNIEDEEILPTENYPSDHIVISGEFFV